LSEELLLAQKREEKTYGDLRHFFAKKMAEREGLDARAKPAASLNEVKATLHAVSNPIFAKVQKYCVKRKSNSGKTCFPSCCLLFAGIA
jgi:hypothetical protein